MFKHVVVVGAGAVGCYYGGMLARAGVKVTLIARPHHVAAIQRDGLLMETTTFTEHVKADATDKMDAVATADMVLLCVKTLDTVTTARAAKDHMAPGAVMVSLQNGVDNAERIKDELGFDVVQAAVYVAASMPGSGHLKHNGRGDLVIGGLPDDAVLSKIKATFEHAKVPCVISKTLPQEMWTKLVMNATYNALSALTGADYGTLVNDNGARDIMTAVAAECVAVANAKKIPLDLADMLDRIAKLGPSMPATRSSTQQDIARGKLTEIDSLNGYVAAQGKKLNVPTPLNAALYGLVHLRERQTPATAGTP